MTHQYKCQFNWHTLGIALEFILRVQRAHKHTLRYSQIQSKCYYGSHTINWLAFFLHRTNEKDNSQISLWSVARSKFAIHIFSIRISKAIAIQQCERERFGVYEISVNFIRGEWNDKEKNKSNRCKTTTLQPFKWSTKFVSAFKQHKEHHFPSCSVNLSQELLSKLIQ